MVVYIDGDRLTEFNLLWTRTWETQDRLYLDVLCPHGDFSFFHAKPNESKAAPGKTTPGFETPIASPPFFMGLHAVCLRPLPSSINGIVKECDSCEEFYLSRTWPDRNFLCYFCSGDA